MKYLLPLIIAFSIFINPVNALAEELILAGGCFWCLEHDLESLKGDKFCTKWLFRRRFNKSYIRKS